MQITLSQIKTISKVPLFACLMNLSFYEPKVPHVPQLLMAPDCKTKSSTCNTCHRSKLCNFSNSWRKQSNKKSFTHATIKRRGEVKRRVEKKTQMYKKTFNSTKLRK